MDTDTCRHRYTYMDIQTHADTEDTQTHTHTLLVTVKSTTALYSFGVWVVEVYGFHRNASILFALTGDVKNL